MVSARLWDAGTVGIEEFGSSVRAYFEDSLEPEGIKGLFSDFAIQTDAEIAAVRVEEAADREPILVGKRFVIIPASRIPLPMDAGMAFGSGRHETTQLCLEALEEVIRPGHTVFDVGCGSGILALACQKLGAGRVIGSDIDEAAIQVARRHFSGPIFVGSADAFPSGQADVVICNITGKVCDRLAADLKRIAKTGSQVVISGFATELRPVSFSAKRVLKLNDWECWICDQEQIHPEVNGGATGEHVREWWI